MSSVPLCNIHLQELPIHTISILLYILSLILKTLQKAIIYICLLKQQRLETDKSPLHWPTLNWANNSDWIPGLHPHHPPYRYYKQEQSQFLEKNHLVDESQINPIHLMYDFRSCYCWYSWIIGPKWKIYIKLTAKWNNGNGWLTKSLAISTAILVTCCWSPYVEISFCMTPVRSSFSVSRITLRSSERTNFSWCKIEMISYIHISKNNNNNNNRNNNDGNNDNNNCNKNNNHHQSSQLTQDRSEERRVGKECRSRWSPYH